MVQFFLSKMRLRFGKPGRQIRTVKGLKEDQMCIVFDKTMGATSLYRILNGKPLYDKKYDCFWIEVVEIDSDGEEAWEGIISLEDHSIFPYSSDKMWNQHICLLRTRAKTSRHIKKRIDVGAFQPVFS